MSKEAMQLALDVLESIHIYGCDTLSGRADGGVEDREWYREGVNEMAFRARCGIEAIKEALAQPEQEPVNKDKIREIFLRNGFTVKDGETDLKQYVYDAAIELLRLAQLEQDLETKIS